MKYYTEKEWLESSIEDRELPWFPELFLKPGFVLSSENSENKSLRSAMDHRHNIKFFDQERIPTKEQIDKILMDRIYYIKFKNCKRI